MNEWYAGNHWTNRKRIKDDFEWLIWAQCKKRFPKTEIYDVEYNFGFTGRVLDISNTIAMVKIIEDILFESDSYKIVKRITITNNKAKEDYVKIIVKKFIQ